MVLYMLIRTFVDNNYLFNQFHNNFSLKSLMNHIATGLDNGTDREKTLNHQSS